MVSHFAKIVLNFITCWVTELLGKTSSISQIVLKPRDWLIHLSIKQFGHCASFVRVWRVKCSSLFVGQNWKSKLVLWRYIRNWHIPWKIAAIYNCFVTMDFLGNSIKIKFTINLGFKHQLLSRELQFQNKKGGSRFLLRSKEYFFVVVWGRKQIGEK